MSSLLGDIWLYDDDDDDGGGGGGGGGGTRLRMRPGGPW